MQHERERLAGVDAAFFLLGDDTVADVTSTKLIVDGQHWDVALITAQTLQNILKANGIKTGDDIRPAEGGEFSVREGITILEYAPHVLSVSIDESKMHMSVRLNLTETPQIENYERPFNGLAATYTSKLEDYTLLQRNIKANLSELFAQVLALKQSLGFEF